MATQVERGRLETGDALSVLKLVFVVTILVEAVVAAILALRMMTAYDMSAGEAVRHGMFHSVSAFNNAGFSTHSDSVMGYQSDPVILVPIMLAVILTALGFPVMQDLRDKRFAWKRWSLHSKVTVYGTAALLVLGFVAILVMEWANAGTLGHLDVGAFHDQTLMVNYLLMFIGDGSAGTAGGIKVTTFIVLFAIVLSEVLGRRDAGLFDRRFGSEVERQALTVTVLAASLIFAATAYISSITTLPLPEILFECISAFATVGMSTGITADLPPPAQVVIVLLMFISRVGTITVATALAVGRPARPYRYPKENLIVG